jgi:hypothetical protein
MDQEDSLVVRTSHNRGVLRVEVSGPGNYANTLAYWKTIAAAVRKHTPHGLLLIDLTTGTALSAQEWKDLVDAMLGQGLEDVRIAHVKPHGLQQIEYCELYAREAGFVARVFTREVEAELWLRYGAATLAAGGGS